MDRNPPKSNAPKVALRAPAGRRGGGKLGAEDADISMLMVSVGVMSRYNAFQQRFRSHHTGIEDEVVKEAAPHALSGNLHGEGQNEFRKDIINALDALLKHLM